MGGNQQGLLRVNSVLLLSGGLDSSAIAAIANPQHCLCINYGQIAAEAEERSARAVATELNLPIDSIAVNASAIGAGLMASTDAHRDSGDETSPEWWPFRNQLLITLCASWAVTRGFTTVLIGTVSTDGERHSDGTGAFLEQIDRLTGLQEGSIRIEAPAVHISTPELISRPEVSDEILRWTHSCHRANLPCANCPGCVGRAAALHSAGRLQ